MTPDDDPGRNNADKPVAIICLSGGLDSCVTTALAAEEAELALLHVSYGQRTAARERLAFDRIAEFYGVPTDRRLVAHIGYLARIGGSSLTDRTIAVPQAPDSGPEDGPPAIPNTYVPFRNTHIISIAVSWAEVLPADRIYLGVVEQDSSGYPDCRRPYFDAAQRLVDLGTRPEADIRLMTPLIDRSKADIVRTGLALGAPLHLSWSCYRNTDVACGECDSCRLRGRAFEQAGQPDPALSPPDAR